MAALLQNRHHRVRLLRLVTHVGALLPLALLLWDFWRGGFGPDPIREITLRTGKPALILLILSLACTPLNIWFGWSSVLKVRRALGLYSFLYVVLHLGVFVYLDYGLDPQLLYNAIFEKWYALVGFVAFLLMLPLALTSTRWAMRRLGKKWKQLHRLAYVAGVLAVVHFLWLVKNAYTEPIIFGVILALLLLSRVPPVRRRLATWRRRARRRLSRREAVS
jgi:sulfoxide reductase heme-binding subunit YedZ